MPQKRDDATPTEKSLMMFSLMLFNGREFSLGEIVEKLNCSKQTASRLLDGLERFSYGRLRRGRHGRESFFSLERPSLPPRACLNPEGLRQLALCRDFMLHLMPESMRRDTEAALNQSTAFLPAEETKENTSRPSGKSLTKGYIDYTPFQHMLDTILHALRDRRVCSVRYQSSLSADEKEYDYAPMLLEVYHEAFFVRGWVVTDKGRVETLYDTPTTLALHRLRAVTMTRRSSEQLPPAEDASSGAFGLLEGDPFKARIRFSPAVSTYVAERRWSEDQHITVHKDTSVTLSLTARSRQELLAWVLGFGEHAQVLSPAWLRRELQDKLTAMLELYAHREKKPSPAERSTKSTPDSET